MGMTGETVQYIITYLHDKRSVTAITNSQKHMTEGNKRLGTSFTSMALRAAAVIPIWLALRSAYMSVFGTIRMGIKHIVDFDKAMARVTAVTHGVENVKEFVAGLKVEIQALALETGISVDKIAEAFYRFGTAGHSAAIAIEGMKVALKTSIAIMGDTTETARTIADVYNLMKNNIKGADTVQEKMNKIGATMAVLWQHNAFELSEFNAALRTFTGTAKTTNLSLDQMMALIAASHTLMQRGGTAGNQLSRTFMMMTKRVDKVNQVLGEQIDLHKDSIFDVYLRLLRKVNKEYGDSAAKLNVLNQIFGMKGFKVTGAFASNLEKVIEELERLKDMPLDERMERLNYLFGIQIDNLKILIDRIGETRKTLGEAFIKGIAGATDFKTALENINKALKDMEPAARGFGAIINATVIKPLQALGIILDLIDLEKERIKREKAPFTKYDFEPLYKMIGPPPKPKEAKPIPKTDEERRIEEEANERKINQALSDRFSILDRLQMYGATSLEIEKEKLRILEEKYPERLQEIEKLQKKINDRMTKDMLKFSETMRKSISEGFEGILKGEAGIGDFFSNITNTIRDTLFKEVSDLFSRKILETTGIGAMFSKQMMAIKTAGNYNAKIWYEAITSAAGGIGGVGGAPGVAWGGGAVAGAPTAGIGTAGFWNQPMMGGKLGPGGMGPRTKPVGPSWGMGATAAMTGYSQYQTATAGGVGTGQAVGAGVATGIGALGLMAGMGGAFTAAGTAGLGLLAGLGPVGWIAAGALLIGGMMMSKGEEPSYRREEVRDQTNKVASRIDISNKELAFVNRNLIDLKREMTYIMQESYYFSEKTESENFAIGSRRGAA